jgi:hypothetical protein
VKEYDLFVPRNYNSGLPVEKKKLKKIKQQLADEFAGVTEIHLRKKGWWKMGNVTFRDKITIFRVYSTRTRQARKFFREMKEFLKKELKQEDILVVEKEARIL